MGCFWTDFVGCVEDCGEAPPAVGTWTLTAFSIFGPFALGTARPYDGADAVAIPSGAAITEGLLYVVVGTGCSYKNMVPAVNGEALGGFVYKDSTAITFGALATFIAATDGVAHALTTPVSVGSDGSYSSSDLLASCGVAGTPNFVFVGSLTDLATSITYSGAGSKDTCF